MVTWLKEYKEVADRETRRLALVEKQQTENKEVLKKILSILKKTSDDKSPKK